MENRKELLNKHAKNLAEINDESNELEKYIWGNETMIMTAENENHVCDLDIYDQHNNTSSKLSDYTDHMFSYSLSAVIIITQHLLHKFNQSSTVIDMLQHIAHDGCLFKWDRTRMVRLNMAQEPMRHSMGWKYATHYFTYAKKDYDKFSNQELVEILEMNKDLLETAGDYLSCPHDKTWKQIKSLKSILLIYLDQLILHINHGIDLTQGNPVVAHPQTWNYNGTEYHLSDVLNWAARNATITFSIYRAIINTICHCCGWYDLYVLRRYANHMTYIIQDPISTDINWSKDNPRIMSSIDSLIDTIENELKEDSMNV